MRRLRRLVSIPLIAVLVLAMAAPVSAAPPEQFVEIEPAGYEIDCGTFLAIGEATLTIRGRVFFDKQGNEKSIMVHFVWRGTVRNSETGFTLADRAAWTIFFDFQTERFTLAGIVWSLTRPGHGVVALEAGLLIEEADGTITLRGPHQVSEGGEEVVCAAVS
jgi:hypothetical protein